MILVAANASALASVPRQLTRFVWSMISAQTVATEKTARILLMAAKQALDASGQKDMADLITGYLMGRAAEIQFSERDFSTDCDLDEGAAEVMGAAEEIAAKFRAGISEVAT